MSPAAFVPRDEDELRDWLHAHGIDTSGYGLGTARPLSSLYGELVTGDSLLTEEDGRPLQLIEGVSLTVTYGDLVLREARQVFTDGRTVSRGFQQGSVSEKLMPGETPEQAAVRGMEEELEREPGEYELFPETHTDTIERLSVAFPGLPGRYVLHRFPVAMLPAGFRTGGYVEHQPDKSTYFEWEVSGSGR